MPVPVPQRQPSSCIVATRCHGLDPGNPTRSASRGFTLLEVLIVVAVIGMLAALAIPSLMSVIRRSRIEGAAQTLTRHILEARAEAIYRGKPVIVHPDIRPDGDGNERHYLVAWVDVDGDGVFGGDISVDGNYTAGLGTYRTVDYPLYEWELPWSGAGKTFRNVYFWGAGDAKPTVAPATSDAIDALITMEDGTVISDEKGYGAFKKAAVFLSNGSIVEEGGIRIAMGPFDGGETEVNFLELHIGPQATGRVELRKFIPSSGTYQPKGSGSGQNGYAYEWEWY